MTRPVDNTTDFIRDEEDVFLKAAQVQRRYGITDVTLLRWTNDAAYRDRRFPQPIRMGRLKLWKLSELVRWEDEQFRPSTYRWCREPAARANTEKEPA